MISERQPQLYLEESGKKELSVADTENMCTVSLVLFLVTFLPSRV
jgi:hypothetical protein